MIVQPLSMKIPLPEGGLTLKQGGVLQRLDVAYETYGALNERGDNAILICTPLTMDQHVAGRHSESDEKPGWWDAMIGPGKAVNTQRHFVICSNMLGGCTGTTGPGSQNPSTGKPYGAAFPAITLEDIVLVQHLLVKNLGVKRLAAVIGGSLGGMQALLWSVQYPEMVEKCVCIAAAPHLSPQALGFEIVGRRVLRGGAGFQGGNYYANGDNPKNELALARMIGLLTYISADSMQSKFGRERRSNPDEKAFKTGLEVESYLEYNARKFTKRFDANSYLHITYAMDIFDLAESYGSLEKAFEGARAEFLLVGLSSDWLFPPQQSRELCEVMLKLGKIVSLVELDSPYGHDAFLLEVGHLERVICSFINDAQTCSMHCVDTGSRKNILKKGAASAIFDASGDYRFLTRLIEPRSHILDIGCGNGELIDNLYESRKTTGFGIDINLENLVECLIKNVPVVHGDVDNGLTLFGDNTFDYAVLSQTMQMLKKPAFVLKEMLRVAKHGIIIFPNLGNIRHRTALALGGVSPLTANSDPWWQTANIRMFSLKDFQVLGANLGFVIDKAIPVSRSRLSAALCKISGLANLGADVIVAKISRHHQHQVEKE